jgi:hypothetical protein
MPRSTRAIADLLRKFAEEDEACRAKFTACPAQEHLHPNYRHSCRDCWNSICKRMQAIGLDDDGDPLPFADLPHCGARTRAGGTCRKKIIPGKARCAFHGGKSTGPTTDSGKARIAEGQRLRWAKWRRDRQLMVKEGLDEND